MRTNGSSLARRGAGAGREIRNAPIATVAATASHRLAGRRQPPGLETCRPRLPRTLPRQSRERGVEGHLVIQETRAFLASLHVLGPGASAPGKLDETRAVLSTTHKHKLRVSLF